MKMCNECSNENEADERWQELLKEEAARNETAYYWLSFADTEKPVGQRFTGVIVTEALGFIHAVDKTHKMGINPGGEVLGDAYIPPAGINEFKDRLLQEAELRERDLV